MVVEDALSLRMNKAKCSRSFGEKCRSCSAKKCDANRYKTRATDIEKVAKTKTSRIEHEQENRSGPSPISCSSISSAELWLV